jgi:hypothetical protein
MSNLRVIYDNAADRATLSTSATAANLGVSKLTTDIKSDVCRSTSTTLTITATWSAAETIGGVVLAFTNCTDNSTIQVDCYTNTGDTTPYFTTTVSASNGGVATSRGVNYFAYGGGIYARCWIDQRVPAAKVVITLSDSGNPQGYVEAGRLIVGDYWLPVIGAEQGNTTMSLNDMSEQQRTYGGDMVVTVRPRFRKQTISMPSLDTNDRAKMWSILWNNGMTKPLFVSLYPNNSDNKLEQAHMLYGRLSTNPVMQTPYFNYQAAKLDIEEV